MELIHCGECFWHRPLEEYPKAQEIHDILHTGAEVGVCARYTYDKERPVIKRTTGFCDMGQK